MDKLVVLPCEAKKPMKTFDGSWCRPILYVSNFIGIHLYPISRNNVA